MTARGGGPCPAGVAALVSDERIEITPKIHYSTTKTVVEERRRRVGRRVERSLVLPQLRAHADLIDPIAFEQFLANAAGLDFDVMLEAKAKDLALLRLREQLSRARAAPAGAAAAGIPAAPMRR